MFSALPKAFNVFCVFNLSNSFKNLTISQFTIECIQCGEKILKAQPYTYIANGVKFCRHFVIYKDNTSRLQEYNHEYRGKIMNLWTVGLTFHKNTMSIFFTKNWFVVLILRELPHRYSNRLVTITTM